MASYPRSPDGAWYWDGRCWLPTGAAPAPLPSFLGRRRGSHWDGKELFLRCIRWPLLLVVVLWSFEIALQFFGLALAVNALAGLPGDVQPSMAWLLVFVALAVTALSGCWLYYLSLAVRPPSLHFSARGLVARQPWRGPFYIPWEAVVRIETHRGFRHQLTVEVAEDFWRYLGRRWTPRWAAWLGPRRSASKIMLPPLGTGMEMPDILRCVREIAPARIPVTDS